MDLGITGRKALIMASSKGLGKAVATELANEGVEIMICSRNEEHLRSAKSEIETKTGGVVHYVVGNVTEQSGRENIIQSAKAKLGTVDILVTNSGGPPTGKFEEHDAKAWESAYKLLLESTVEIIKGALPGMKTQQWGRIVTISSQAIKQPVNGLILSNSVRASLLGLVKTLSNELGPYNITVNNVLPGYTETERLTQLRGDTSNWDTFTKDVPLGRVAQPKEFAAAVTFLCSQRASYITGISLPVDGGWIKGI
ncbi:MAG: SDR family oxidoreductase [Balneolaceae bacterium]|nr:SDR family oxidoreductase [Balneolaceae bacterium]MBO6546643.1 SDR family oxidoreductase [Balneolaceae bacterium]MBO6649001.1 SDR family oxidoreductase [Balneolaceae bacterium]